MTSSASIGERIKERLSYAAYLWAQVRQTRAKRHKDASFRLRPFAGLVRRLCPELMPASCVLSIGPRNELEIVILEEAGLGQVTAIDLWPMSRRIQRGDMHRMTLADDSFDLIFASHVFEHAYDFSKVAAECVRILRPRGYVFCAVPTNFQPTEHDRTYFGSSREILTHFAAAGPRILHEESRPTELVLLFQLLKGNL